MALEPVTALLEVGSKLIDRLWPDKEKADAAKLELFKLQQTGELAGIAGQLEINKAEATNASVFVSGWRPFIGWVCGFGLVYSFLGQPLLSWASSSFGIGIPPTLELGNLLTILGGMLGLSGLRTFEKVQGVASK